ncbi:hypothetical protein RhiJN_00172 [Ceratobasidium sp. AG-Ba]|nr:hypothetical protein RhiJN_00172 [Ceratobasidium sp. AG-Ba]
MSKEVLDSYEGLLRLEHYTVFVAKHRIYTFDLVLGIASDEDSMNHLIQQRYGASRQSRPARALALYQVARQSRNQILDLTKPFAVPDVIVPYHQQPSLDLSYPRLTRPPYMRTLALWWFGPELISSKLAMLEACARLSTAEYIYLRRSCMYSSGDRLSRRPIRDWPHLLSPISFSMHQPTPRQHTNSPFQTDIPIGSYFHDTDTNLTIKLPFQGNTSKILEKGKYLRISQQSPLIRILLQQPQWR